MCALKLLMVALVLMNFPRGSGVRSRGMTPEVTQESGRRRTTSEGQYQSSHDSTPMVDSPDFAHSLILNSGGRSREVSLVTVL